MLATIERGSSPGQSWGRSRSGIIRAAMHPQHYSEIERVLADERSLADAAEAHGTLTGCLCAAIGYRFEDWLLEILPEGRAQPLSRETLRELYMHTAGALEGPEMQFELL